MAQLELLNALNSINSEAELNEFKSVLAHYFALKAQKAIDKLWDEGVINEETIVTRGQSPCAFHKKYDHKLLYIYL